MKKKSYSSFADFLQKNYAPKMVESFTSYAEKNETLIHDDKTNKDHKYEYVSHLTIEIYGVQYTYNQFDQLEFNVHFTADFLVTDGVFDEKSKFPEVVGVRNNYVTKMNGSFEKGFDGGESKDIVKIEGKQERFTSSLVPVISVDEMDDYAEKFLKFFYPKALEEPTFLPVDKMLKDKGISVYYAPLDENIYGETFFGSGKAKVYDPTKFITKKTIEIDVKPGTILINRDKAWSSYEGMNRNTMVHEAIHWYFHRNYFELRKLLDPKKTKIVCCKGLCKYENDDIKWMEWQARNLAPHILMPKETSKKKYAELADEANKLGKEKDWTLIQRFHYVLNKFASFFGVTKQSARIRLRELGLKQMDGIGVYVDNEPIESFVFDPACLKKNETFVINKKDLKDMRERHPWFDFVLTNRMYLYRNGMVVLNDKKYVRKNKLTEYALYNAHECCLRFNIKSISSESKNAKTIKAYLKSSDSASGKITKDPIIESASLTLNCLYKNEGKSKVSDNQYCKCKTISELLNYYKINCKVSSNEKFEYFTGVSSVSLAKYLDGSAKPEPINLIKIGIGLKLTKEETLHMLNINGNISTNITDKEQIFYHFLVYQFAGVEQGLIRAYKALKKQGKENSLCLTAKYLKDHDLIEINEPSRGI